LGPALGALVGPLADFDRHPSSLTTPLGLGIPDWVFYGVVLPWLICVVVTWWFCQYFYVDDDLGDTVVDENSADGTSNVGN
jgi:hypothetical protein